MSTTPRTDSHAGWAIPSLYGQQLTSLELLADSKGIFVHAVFARQLETELASMTARAEKAEAELAKAREKVRVLRDALERRHTEQGYHRQYVDDILAATEEASK